MKDSEDAYGHVNWEHFQGRESQEVIERDDGYIDVSGGPRVYFSAYKEWPPHERQAMRYVRGRVLDVGCGPGRHALYLQNRGHAVTGIDISPLNVRICHERGLRDSRVMSVTRLQFPTQSFDTVLMLGNNFGLMATPERARWLLRRFKTITTPSARIIAQSLDPRRTKEPAHREYHEWNRSRGRMPGQVRIRVRWKKYRGKWFDYLFVSQKEMEGILRGTGWRIARILHDKGPLYIAVIERAPEHPGTVKARPRPRASA